MNELGKHYGNNLYTVIDNNKHSTSVISSSPEFNLGCKIIVARLENGYLCSTPPNHLWHLFFRTILSIEYTYALMIGHCLSISCRHNLQSPLKYSFRTLFSALHPILSTVSQGEIDSVASRIRVTLY